MKTKKVNRYYCDYCKKSGGASYAMQQHEISCTGNPLRYCKMCKLLQLEQKPMIELLKTIPIEYKGIAVPEALQQITNNCPVCIFAALRQSGSISYVEFDLKTEIQQTWKDMNEQVSY